MEKIKEFKKVFLQKIIPCVISCVLAVGLACGSYAWYSSSVKFEFNKNFSGTTDVAYFAGGDGSIGNPYIINNRYHIYNLAWLQYLGYFNLGSQVNNGRAQNYFKITANINMEGLAIPPIGTEKYKFIGNIEGNGYAVSNLVVSNDINSLTVRPSTINSVDDCSIVGFFGVLGASASELTQMKTDGKTAIIDGNAVPVEVDNTADAPKPTATAVQAANLIYKKAISAQNFYLDKINVVSTTPKTLIGIAAGYVAGNLQNVGVYQSAVSVEGSAQGLATALTDGGTAYGTIVSRYSIVGDYDEKNVTWDSLPSGAGGEGPGFGDSIDMRTLARRINYMMAATTSKSDNTQKITYINKNTAFYYNEGYNIVSKVQKGTNYMFSYTSANTLHLLGGDFDFGNNNTKKKYSFLPLGINTFAMGLDNNNANSVSNTATLYKYGGLSTPFNGTSDSVSVEFSGIKEYAEKTSETVKDSNTGYIVGYNRSGYTDGAIQINVRRRDDSNGNIAGAFKGNNYSNDKFALLYYDYAETEATKKFKYIKDKYNTVGGNYTGPDGETVELSGQFAADNEKEYKYYVMRDNANFQRYMGIGDGNDNIYGLEFYSQSGFKPLNERSQVYKSYDSSGKGEGKQYVPGAINFKISNGTKGGVITAVVGAYSYYRDQNAFSLYKVKYKANNSNEIESLEKIESVKKDGKEVYNAKWYNETEASAVDGKLPKNYAYYIEIPVDDGDYVMGLGYANTCRCGYLMYLDIGANGGNTDTTQKPVISTVTFVDEVPTGTVNREFVEKEYNVVVFFLDEPKGGTAKVVIYFKRKTDESSTGGTEKSKIVYYYPVPGLDAMGKITPTPSAYGENNQEAQNWN